MFRFNKNCFLPIFSSVLLIALTAQATTKIKIVNKTGQAISVELFEIIGENKGLKLERIEKATLAVNEVFSEEKLAANETYMVKVMSDTTLLKQLVKNANKKIKNQDDKNTKKIDNNYLEQLDNTIVDKEHYFIIPPLSKKEVVHINLTFNQDTDEECFVMRKTKNNVHSNHLQYGTFLTNDTISPKFDQALTLTKTCFMKNEKSDEIYCVTAQLMIEAKEKILDAIGKSEDDDQGDSRDFDEKKEKNEDKKEQQFIKKASMKLLLQGNFSAKDSAASYNQVLSELKQINLKKRE